MEMERHLNLTKDFCVFNIAGSSDFEFEFEQESPDAGYQSPGKEEMEAPAFISDGKIES